MVSVSSLMDRGFEPNMVSEAKTNFKIIYVTPMLHISTHT